MKDAEFEQWFMENLGPLSEQGVYHWRSQWGKVIRLALLASETRMRELHDRIDKLEQQLRPQPRDARGRFVKRE